MSAGFTPRPWQVLPNEADKLYIRVRGTRLGERYKVANVLFAADIDFERVEAEANARLIATAPELYEALDQIRRLLPEGRGRTHIEAKIISIVEPALAKARGEQP